MTPGAPAKATAAAPGTPAARKLDRSLVEGPIAPAVWRMAWPTVLQNAIGGLQGIIDHAMVGHYVGFTGNAAIGVSWQIFLVVIVFIASLFTGMGVLVARFAGANEPDKVNRTVYQAFLTALILSLVVLAPLGYVLSPTLLDLVNATPAVKAEALPFLRTMFVFSIGMLLFFMLGGALALGGRRPDAAAPRHPHDGAERRVQRRADPRPRSHSRRSARAGPRSARSSASLIASSIGIWLLLSGRLVVHFPETMSRRPDLKIIRSLFKFGLPAGIQGVAMNIAGVMLLRFIGSLPHSAEAQAAYAVGYAELFALITWTSVGLMGAAAAVAGQNLGAGQPERAIRGVQIAARIGIGVAAIVGAFFLLIPEQLLAIFGLDDPNVVAIGTQLLRYLCVSGFFITVALTYTGGLQGTGDTRSPLYITLVSQVLVPLGLVRNAPEPRPARRRRRLVGDRPRPFHALLPVGAEVQPG